MSERTGIGWTDATWNPVSGCSIVSPGCTNCYAQALSLRYGWSKKPWTAPNAAENVVLHPERLSDPLHWRKPRRVFVNSMSDLFHERVPDEFIAAVFGVMAAAWQHTFQVLTKRPERMQTLLTWLRSQNTGDVIANATGDLAGGEDDAVCALANYINGWSRWRAMPDDGNPLDGTQARWPLPNVWLGVSVEDQRRAEERIPILLHTPTALRWISAEPLLGPIDLTTPVVEWDRPRSFPMISMLDWVVVGGESGPGYRPMDVAWLESIVRQCQVAGVPTFVKQDSGARPGQQGRIPDDLWALKEYPR